MKKFAKVAVAGILAATSACAFGSCAPDNTIYVATNAYFAPFEYFDDDLNIVGVDVDIMKKVGEELNRPVKFVDMEFKVIIDNVASGKQYDVGAAGITYTSARADKVDFSTPYYTSIQYVIYKTNDATIETTTLGDGTECVFWSELKGKILGVQQDTTGDLMVSAENKAISEYTEVEGVLYDGNESDDHINEKRIKYNTATQAVSEIATHIDAVVIDELPAKYLCSKSSGAYVCKPLYYDADKATVEEYAICVTKGNKELLDAINKVLADLGKEGVDALVANHFGVSE